MLTRTAIVLVLLASAGVYTSSATGPEAAVGRTPLSELPLSFDGWRGYATTPFADDVIAQLGVDDYVNRRYMRETAPPVFLYVGYYGSQRQGDTIHSPQNCLPGAGWQPLESGRIALDAGRAGRVEVNRYVIAKGADRQVVLYWYQGRNRVVASEYRNKFLLMLDAARLHRTNGGLVRLMAPVDDNAAAATDEATSFARALLPKLGAYLP
jgi:EpsI family protein